MLILISTPALAEEPPPGQVLYEGTEIHRPADDEHPELELLLGAAHLLLTIDEGRRLLVERKAGQQAIAALRAIEQVTEDESVLELLGWPVVITAVVVVAAGALVGGIFLGAELARPAVTP